MLRLSTCSNRSFSDETVKNFSRVSCRLGQSTNICLTVSGSLQHSQTGWSSPDIKYQWVRRQWQSYAASCFTGDTELALSDEKVQSRGWSNINLADRTSSTAGDTSEADCQAWTFATKTGIGAFSICEVGVQKYERTIATNHREQFLLCMGPFIFESIPVTGVYAGTSTAAQHQFLTAVKLICPFICPFHLYTV